VDRLDDGLGEVPVVTVPVPVDEPNVVPRVIVPDTDALAEGAVAAVVLIEGVVAVLDAVATTVAAVESLEAVAPLSELPDPTHPVMSAIAEQTTAPKLREAK
jgi:hypothetical protein